MGSSVVRLSVAECAGTPSMGSGFVVGDDLVMTAAHVVVGTRTVSFQTSTGELGAASIVAYDLGTDSALLRTEVPLKQPALDFDTEPLAQGSGLLVLGYPLWAYDLRVAQGIVSGLNDTAEYSTYAVKRVFTTDAATNGGNSGGPVVNRSGQVIGLVSGGINWDSTDAERRRPVEGINYVVPADDLRQKVAEWAEEPKSEFAQCPDDVDVDDDESATLRVQVDSKDRDAGDIAQIFQLHGQAINEGSYEAAWRTFTAPMQRRMGGLGRWSSGLQTSIWQSLSITDLVKTGDDTATLTGRLRTRQDPRFGRGGQSCSDWVLHYRVRRVEGVWLIDDARAPRNPRPC